MNIRKVSWTYQGKKSSAWRLDCRVDGVRIQKQYRTKVLAELAYQKLIQGSDLSPGRLPSISFSDFVTVYVEKKSWKTESYKERVARSLSQVPFTRSLLSTVTRGTIETFRDDRASCRAASTIRQDIAALHDLFKWAIKLGYLRKNPCDGLERPSLPVKQDDPQRAIPPDEFEKLIEKAGRDAPLYTFAAWTGLRLFELLALEWEDVRDRYVLVRRGKGRKQRMVPLLKPALEALQAVPRHFSSKKVFWFIPDRFSALKRLKRRLKWAGLPTSYRFHDLRHTFGSNAAMSGVDPQVIAEAMGHTNATVTKLYMHLHPNYRRAELVKMERMGRTGGEASRKFAKTKRR